MDKKTRYILHWIGQLSKVRPELGNFSICPYASGANFSIQEQKLSQIVPNSDFDVIIYIVEDNINILKNNFGSDTNKVSIIDHQHLIFESEELDKNEISRDILNALEY